MFQNITTNGPSAAELQPKTKPKQTAETRSPQSQQVEKLLCTAIAQHVRKLRGNFSCGQTYQLLGGGSARRQQRRQNASAFIVQGSRFEVRGSMFLIPLTLPRKFAQPARSRTHPLTRSLSHFLLCARQARRAVPLWLRRQPRCVHRVSAVELRPEEFAQMNKTFADSSTDERR